MASRNIGGSIQAALKDLFDERAVVEDAIEKLQALLANMKAGVSQKRRGRPPGSTNKKVAPAAKRAAKVVAKPGRKKKATSVAESDETSGRSWSPAARRKASQRMRAFWAERAKETEARSKNAGKRRGRAAAGK